MPSSEAKYFDLLARYYVLKRQHLLAAHVLLRLAERRSTDAKDAPTLDQRSAVFSFLHSRQLMLGSALQLALAEAKLAST